MELILRKFLDALVVFSCCVPDAFASKWSGLVSVVRQGDVCNSGNVVVFFASDRGYLKVNRYIS